MRKFEFLKTYLSPFKPIKPKFYIGKIKIGTPYFFPRKWIQSDKPGYLTPVPRKVGFDFVGLGFKTKWSVDDYRYEYSPVWSFVFYGYQIALIFEPKYADQYWESWLSYYYQTNDKLTPEKRIEIIKQKYPCTYIVYSEKGEEKINYYNNILKKNYLN